MFFFRLLIISTFAFVSAGLVPTIAFAYQVSVPLVSVPYEVTPLLYNNGVTQVILGELQDVPEMFEIIVEATSTLRIEMKAVPTAAEQPTFSGIIIKQKEIRGIEEVARLSATDAVWNEMVDAATGLLYLAGPVFSETVTPGTYRIEVSNPSNQGKYLLVIGTNSDDESYLASLRAVSQTYEFYGTNKIKLFNSPYVHYPLGIALLLILIGIIVYKTRHRFITTAPIHHA